MATVRTDILVYAHWKGIPAPKLIGVLSAQQAKGRKAISFEYDDDWLHSKEQRLLDPEINWYGGPQYPWTLSPAYDINPSIDKDGLALNIDADQNNLDFELARSVGEYFQVTTNEMDIIIDEIKKSVRNWRATASHIGISRGEQEMMEAAFRF